MKRLLPLFLLLSICSLTADSQTCGSDILRDKLIRTDSNYLKTSLANQKLIEKAVERQTAASALARYFGMQATIYTIPVVVHVMHTGGAIGTQNNPSDLQIQQTIDYMNSVFNGTLPGGEGAGEIGIQFVLANRDTLNNPTNGIDRKNLGGNSEYVTYGVSLQDPSHGLTDDVLKGLARWDPGLYYNIYLVNLIDGTDGSLGGPFVAGYAFEPSVFVNTDGTVLLAKTMKPDGKVLPHELGHALGLAHPFQGSSGTTCPPAGPCASTGDFICDTDPITQPPFVDRTGQVNPCTGGLYTINTEHNFMNYTDQFTLFTEGQKTRMLATMTLPVRASLAGSWAKNATYPYSFSNPITHCPSASATLGTNSFVSGLTSVRVNNRQFSSGVTRTDPGYVDKSRSPLHLIPLDRGAAYPLTVDLFTFSNPQQVAAFIDYNDDGNFDATEVLLYADNVDAGGDYTRITTSFSVPTTAVANKVLRMRVINEVAAGFGFPITSGCYAPTYGQTEDFPVFIASVLPASWKYFKGRKSGSDVLLEWGINTELKNGLFEVERSGDGISFKKIGSIQSEDRKFLYNFTDHDANLPAYFYRIRQTDQTGQQTLSSIVIIKNGDAEQDNTVRVANPFSDVIDVYFDRSWQTAATIELLDLNGRRLLQQQISAGTRVFHTDVSHLRLTSGLYMLKITAGDAVITKKIMHSGK